MFYTIYQITNTKNGKVYVGKHQFIGRSHTQRRERKCANQKNIGPVNSQFGTMWITDEVDSIKVDKNSTVPEGWRKGRVVKSK